MVEGANIKRIIGKGAGNNYMSHDGRNHFVISTCHQITLERRLQRHSDLMRYDDNQQTREIPARDGRKAGIGGGKPRKFSDI